MRLIWTEPNGFALHASRSAFVAESILLGSAYLSTAHRDAPERGCAFAALAGELARESPAARRALTMRLEGLLGFLGEHVPDRRGVSGRRQAMAVLSCLVAP